MDLLQTILIAIVEGLTEFLPVSSTGHMIIAEKVLNVASSDFVKAFTVIIQFGAILSVIVLYWKRFFRLNDCTIFDQNNVGKEKSFALNVSRLLYKYDFYIKLLIAVVPALVLGKLFSEKIDLLLENVNVVAIMLIVGGLLMLFVDKWFSKVDDGQSITPKKAIIIGFAQCIAMIPGVSRSMATIVGGMSQKLNRKTAAEFSFFLAVPTMFAASGYKLLKLVMDSESRTILEDKLDILLIGNIVAFFVAMLAIKFFIGFVTKYGFKAFGYYRIIVGAAILILSYFGYELNVL